MKPSTGNTSIVQPKCCCHKSDHFIFNYTVIMQALGSIILGSIWNRHGKWSVITLGFGFQFNWPRLFCLRQKTTTVSAFCVWTGVAHMSLFSWVCSTVNCHRYCADGDTLFCQTVNVLKDFSGYLQKLWISLSLIYHTAPLAMITVGVKLNWPQIGQLFYRIISNCRKPLMKPSTGWWWFWTTNKK